MIGETALAAYCAFQAALTAHGPLLVSVDEPSETGDQVWAARPCGAEWERYVTLAEVHAEAHRNQASATQRGP